MPYNAQIHHRRSIRLKGYDYTQPGAYYITICTKEKQCLFGDVVQDKMRLNHFGKIAFTCWRAIPEHFPHVKLDVFVIMPNHVHGILVILNTNSRGTAVPYPYKEQFGKPVPGSIPTVIRSYKSAVTKKINSICNTKGKSLVWQRDFYEHINRDEESLNNIRQYIQENPLAWEKDLENPRHHPKNHSLLIDIPF